MIVVLTVGVMSAAVWGMLFGSYALMMNDVRKERFRIPLIRHIIIKYNDCVNMNVKVESISDFVENQLYNSKICGLSLKKWEKTAKATIVVPVVAGIAAAFFRMIRKYIMINSTSENVMLLNMRFNREGSITSIIIEVILCTLFLFLIYMFWNESAMVKQVSGELSVYILHKQNKDSQMKVEGSKKLRGRAAAEFEKMCRNYEKIESRNSIHVTQNNP